MLVSRQVILAGVETTYNTAPSLSASTDAVLVENISLAFEGLRMAEREPTRPSLAAVEKVYGGALMTVTFDVELKSKGIVDTAPEMDALLLGCGLVKSTDSGDVVYKPTSDQSSMDSITLEIYQDGILFQVTGCRGSVTGNLTTGEVGKLSFTFSGHYTRTGTQSPTDVALPTPTYSTDLPPPVVNAGLVIQGVTSPVASDITFDMGLEVGKPVDMSTYDGFGEVQITKRAVTGTVNPEGFLIANEDIYADLRQNALLQIGTGVIGGADQGYQINFPKAQLTDVSQGDREGIRTFDLTFAAMENTGNDEIEIRFTNPAA